MPPGRPRRRPGIRAYRRPLLLDGQPQAGRSRYGGRKAQAEHPQQSNRLPRSLRPRVIDNIPVTGPAVVLVDIAPFLPTGQLEAAVNEADHRDLVDPRRCARRSSGCTGATAPGGCARSWTLRPWL